MAADTVDSDDVLQLLIKRTEMLQELRGEPTRRAVLQERLDISRSTVYNSLKELTRYRIVTQTDDGYQLTLYGQAVLNTFNEFEDQLGKLTTAQEALDTVSIGQTIQPLLEQNPDIVTPSENDPDRPVDVFENLVREADTVCAFSPITSSRYVKFFTTQIIEEGLEATIINESSVVEYLIEHHRDDFRSTVREDRVSFYKTDVDLPFVCLVIRSPIPMVVCTLYNEQNSLQALIYSEGSEAVEWGESLFEQEREQATLITESYFD